MEERSTREERDFERRREEQHEGGEEQHEGGERLWVEERGAAQNPETGHGALSSPDWKTVRHQNRTGEHSWLVWRRTGKTCFANYFSCKIN